MYQSLLLTMLVLSTVTFADTAETVRCHEIGFSQAVERGDPEKFRFYLDDDARFMGTTVLRGPQAVADAWGVFFAAGGPSIKWRPQFVEVLENGRLALTRGPYRMTTTGEDGAVAESWGTFNSVWRLKPDGHWKVVFDAGSPANQAPAPEVMALLDQEYGCGDAAFADPAGPDPETAAALDAVIAGEHRSAENKARDVYRRPRETLAFFGFRPDMTVVEIWPGGGWYTEILAPALMDKGKLYAAQYGLNPAYGYQRRYLGEFLGKLGASPDIYRDVVITQLDVPYEIDIAPGGSADLVLTFRNAHNWVNPGYGEHTGPVTFRVMFDALKPGGVLGVVDHRWPDPATEDPAAENGYVSEARIIALAEAAGFRLAARSDMNRNEKDTHDHPWGVWSLPPSLALGDQDREKYLAIGESDRMTLKFVKPVE